MDTYSIRRIPKNAANLHRFSFEHWKQLNNCHCQMHSLLIIFGLIGLMSLSSLLKFAIFHSVWPTIYFFFVYYLWKCNSIPNLKPFLQGLFFISSLSYQQFTHTLGIESCFWGPFVYLNEHHVVSWLRKFSGCAVLSTHCVLFHIFNADLSCSYSCIHFVSCIIEIHALNCLILSSI